MNHDFICTTGTSIATGIRYQGDAAAYAAGIRERIGTTLAERPRDAALQFLSAELNSLVRLGAEAGDSVHLLHTDTDDGRVTAECLAQLINDQFDISATLYRIEGLQVTDAARFRQIGIHNLFATIDNICGGEAQARYQRDRFILNASGGFKGVVPYLTLYGLLNRLDVTYIFERSDALITLPPVPLNYDHELIARARPALEQLDEASAMPEEAFFQLIPGLDHAERWRYEPFLVREGDEVMPSVFGFMALDELRAAPAPVYLSAHAAKSLDAATDATREQFIYMLSRIGERAWRQAKHHSFNGTDLNVFKPGNTAERCAAILRDDAVYVCELYGDHKTYDSDLPKRKRKDYDLATFTAWAPADTTGDDANEPPAADLERRLQKHEADFRQQVRRAENAESERAQALKDRDRYRAEGEAGEKLRTELTQTHQQHDDAAERCRTLEARLEALQPAAEFCRRTWWQRLFAKAPTAVS